MADASSIRKTTTPLAPASGVQYPSPGSLSTIPSSGSLSTSAAFYESAIRFQINPAGYNFTYTDANGVTQTRKTGQAYVCSGAQWVPVGNVVLNVPVQVGADAINQTTFIADRPYNVLSVKEVHETAESTATTLTASVVKCTGTTAVASGTSVLTGTFNLKSAADTVQSGTLSSTIAYTQLAAGDRLGVKISAAATEFAGGLLTIVLQPQ